MINRRGGGVGGGEREGKEEKGKGKKRKRKEKEEMKKIKPYKVHYVEHTLFFCRKHIYNVVVAWSKYLLLLPPKYFI